MPFAEKEDSEASEAYASKERPLFKAPSKLYPHGLKTSVLLSLFTIETEKGQFCIIDWFSSFLTNRLGSVRFFCIP